MVLISPCAEAIPNRQHEERNASKAAQVAKAERINCLTHITLIQTVGSISRSIQPAIRRQPVQTALATKAAFLVAAERTCRVELVVGVRPDDAGAQLVDHLENLAALVRPHARAQAVGNVVRALERLLRSAERHHAQHRPENFLARHAMRVRDARLRGRSRSVAAKAREKRLRDNSVENSVKHFQFNANWRLR